jgi:TatA/E family protein of Tat protein translocase
VPIAPGPAELITLLLIVRMLFGAGKLAELGGALGAGIREIGNATRDVPLRDGRHR